MYTIILILLCGTVMWVSQITFHLMIGRRSFVCLAVILCLAFSGGKYGWKVQPKVDLPCGHLLSNCTNVVSIHKYDQTARVGHILCLHRNKTPVLVET
jgi:hypothetical protein